MSKKLELEAKLDELEIWFKENPKLPEEIDRFLLKRFLKCMFGDIEETKKLIEVNFELRNRNSHIFLDRDPEDENVKMSRQATDLIILPGLTPKGHKVMCFRINDLDPSKMDSISECKTFFMIADSRFTMADKNCNEETATKKEVKKNIKDEEEGEEGDEDNDEDEEEEDNMASGDVQIVDIAGYTMSHIARISFLTLRIYMKFLQEAYPVRLKAMHVINCPSYLDKMVAVVRPFINDDVYKMIHFHKNGLESLYEHIPRDMLPEEYGGKAGKISELKDKWTEILEKKRDYLMDPKQWKAQQPEGKRWYFF